MAEYLSPGVYVEEFDSGAVPMQGASTSTAGFIGLAERGSVTGKPQLVTSFADYKRMYGDYLSEAKFGSARYLPYAVEQFFMNGGSRAYIMRAAAEESKAAAAAAGVLRIAAANPGSWGDRLRVTVTPSSKGKTQVLSAVGADLTLKNAESFVPGDVVELCDGSTTAYSTVKSVQGKVVTLAAVPAIDVVDGSVGTAKYIKTCEITVTVRVDDMMEEYQNVSINPALNNYISIRASKSDLISVSIADFVPEDGALMEYGEDGQVYNKLTPYQLVGGNGSQLVLALSGGSDGKTSNVSPVVYLGVDNGPGSRTALQAFREAGSVSLMAVPGVTEPAVQAALIAFCEEQQSCFAILDAPMELKKTDELLVHRDLYDSSYAAMYHPWLEMFDAGGKRSAFFPPSGAMAGIFVRTDTERGVHKAPANEVVRGCTGLSCAYNQGEQDVLNPAGVNLIRAFTGRGIRVWGARTLSSNGLWKYVNVRRLFIYVEESIRANTNWVVFEPNSENLWGRVKRTIEMFLATCWRDGALAGTAPSEAFYVECGATTMTKDDIDNGRLICQIGIAPVKPAEFVIFRITQKTASGE